MLHYIRLLSLLLPLILLVVVGIVIRVCAPVSLPASPVFEVEEPTTEEGTENIVSIEVVLVVMSLPCLVLILFFTASLVVQLSLLFVTQACKSSTYFLEGILGLRSLVLVRVELEGQFSVCFFNVVF